MITLDVLAGIIGRADAPDWIGPIGEACYAFEIDTLAREIPFLAQCAHESGGFVRLEENLNYSADRLIEIFPKYFRTPTQARAYARKPEAIANRVYANRIGNGDEASGDGWLYRGRGLFQLTGRANYTLASHDLAADYVSDPDLLSTIVHAAWTAAWFWHKNGCNAYADAGDFVGLTRRINGGTIGLEDRLAWRDKVQELYA